MGNCYDVMGEHSKSIEFYEKALAISEAQTDKNSSGTYLANLGLQYAKLGLFEKSEELFRNSLQIAYETDYVYGKSKRHRNLADVLIDTGNYTEAIENAKSSIQLNATLNSNEIISEAHWTFRLGFSMQQ